MPPKTTKERSQAYRDQIKADPIKYEERLKRDRERYLRKKEKGVVKATADLSKREHRKQRRQWRINQRNRREEIKKNSQCRPTFPPPHSPDVPLQPEHDVDLPPTPPSAQSQSQKQRGRKKVARNRQKVYQALYESNAKLEKALRKA